jgi:hypothetical protein
MNKIYKKRLLIVFKLTNKTKNNTKKKFREYQSQKKKNIKSN